MPLQSIPSSSDTASHVDPKLAEFGAMNLEARLERLEKLVKALSKAKSMGLDEALSRLKIWQTTEVHLDDRNKVVD